MASDGKTNFSAVVASDGFYGNLRSGLQSTFTKSVDTNGTTAVSVFGTSGPGVALTIKSVSVISLDTTAGNITVENPASTVVATIAKGVTAGVVTGATTLANTAVAATSNLVVDSSSAGNARVLITFEVA